MMTKKDYELLARQVREGWSENEPERVKVAERLADALAPTNPRFDRDRFLRACQPESVRESR